MGAGGGGISLSASSRSRSGFSARNFSSSWFNSIVESCSRRIDCCSCGVSVRCCESLSCRVCFIEMRREGLARRIVVQTGHIGNGVYRGMRCPLQPEIFAEINASYVFIINDLVRFAEGEHQSVVDDVGVVANPQRFPHVMVRDEDADAAFLEKADDFLNVEYRDRVDAREGFIEQYEARARRERPGDLDAAALAAREGERGRLSQMCDVEITQQPGEAGLDFLLEKFLQLQHG